MGDIGEKWSQVAQKGGSGRTDYRPVRASYTDVFEHSFDEKGRITIPADWRTEAYESRLFIFPSKKLCLKVYPESWLGRLQEAIASFSLDDPQRLRLEALAQMAQAASWDQQGRITVKERLRTHAQLKKEAILVGCLDHFQIWAPDRWKAAAPRPLQLEEVIEGWLLRL
ncbi:division/cell wall cluster transcriptional repressor MraZ [Candidatus Methylacidithermus pantelleriae]|uniref:Transcriptional regulator MraZ n=1 Tax=Candidatus Methylacidithermus pantelleriae TaxID=2744239 RepID=A0A8J2BNX1_9BACT|nr:division/cell wall cluster transcriptional repressor MraZ [Candidatus Methylacidithermus pantelleriae]CAF0694958.1 Transcriptional regulator MraZ [Candidatus Methylacidithermus pantelleriae]